MSKPPKKQSDHVINKVIKMHDDDLKNLEESLDSNSEKIFECISNSEKLLTELGIDLPMIDPYSKSNINDIKKPIVVQNWEDIESTAEQRYPDIVRIEEIFTKEELEDNHEYILGLQQQFKDINKLDKWDFAVAGIVGTLAALIDLFLVTKVDVSNGNVTPGVLKSGVEKLWDKILPADKVSLLESKYKVPFDISTNTSKISHEVLGLNPKHHRFQSLGHDPLLGFIFGVKDLMRGELTAIDGNGRRIVQSVSGAEGKDFIEAIIMEFGHLLSDVNATSPTGMKISIPAPLTPLLQMVQDGSVSYKGKKYTVGDLSKRMYYDGYNFNHFIGMSIPVILIHLVIKLFTILREMFSDDYSVTKHKSDILLFVSNSILCAENVGKLVVTENPFSINYVSWMDTAKYSVRALKYVLVEYHLEEIEHIQKVIDNEFADTYELIENTWNRVCCERPIVYL